MKAPFALCLCVWGVLFGAGCRRLPMAEQPRYDPLEASRFFADGRSARPIVLGTVARGQATDNAHAELLDPSTQKSDSPSLDRRLEYVDTFPVPVTLAALHRGRERFNIYCAACHDLQGTGSGKVVARGFPPASSFHEDRLRQAPVGYLFDVTTRGYKTMPAFARLIDDQDRWAIIGYIRALQSDRQSPLGGLPPKLDRLFPSRVGGRQWEATEVPTDAGSGRSVRRRDVP